MPRFMSALGWVALIAASGASAQNAPIREAMDRGNAMYRYDRAAWITSDDLLARLPVARQAEVGGWIVTPSTRGLRVSYFGKGSAADRVIYSADVTGETISNATVYPTNSGPPLDATASQMARALVAAWSEMRRNKDWQPCTNAAFNTIVLAPGPDGYIPVYFLTPQTVTDSFPFGGHYRVDVDAAGKVVSKRAFTRSCLNMTKPPLQRGSMLSALFVTHILDKQPTEIHVFEQRYANIPVMVSTGPKSVWEVNDGKITDASAMIAK